MALAVTVTFTILDEQGKTSKMKVRVPTGFSVPQYTEFAQDLANIVTPLINGQITRATFSVAADLSGLGLATVPAVSADIFQKGLIVANSSVGGLFAKMNIPTFDEAKIVAGSDNINQADVAVAALLDAITDGYDVSIFHYDPVDLRGNDLVSISKARELFRKH